METMTEEICKNTILLFMFLGKENRKIYIGKETILLTNTFIKIMTLIESFI
jgi:hypothetical protein